jgi:hypothetical protein
VAPTKAEGRNDVCRRRPGPGGRRLWKTLEKLDALDARQPDVAAAKNCAGSRSCAWANMVRGKGAAKGALSWTRFLGSAVQSRGGALSAKNWAEARDRFIALGKEA